MEIRKHKWLESEKLGQEIGFATAACDWINKYGYTWKQFRLDAEDTTNLFLERRKYRRFNFHLPVQLKTDQNCLISYTIELSLIGLSCILPTYIPENTNVEMTINIDQETSGHRLSNFKFSSRVLRISQPKPQKSQFCYEIFLPFNEQARDYLRNTLGLFNN